MDGTANINDVLKYTSTVSCQDPEYKTKAPQIQLSNGDGYDIYWLVTDADFEESAPGSGILAPGSENWTKGLGWIDESGYNIKVCPEYKDMTYCFADGEITPGTGIWFKDPSNPGTITANGQVANADVTIDNPTGFRIRANPFPVAICISDDKAIQFTKTGTSDPLSTVSVDDNYQQDAPQLQLANGAGYDIYWFVNDADFEESEPGSGILAPGSENWTKGPGWIDESGYKIKVCPEYKDMTYCFADGVIQPTTGFWARSTKDDYLFTMKFIAPVK